MEKKYLKHVIRFAKDYGDVKRLSVFDDLDDIMSNLNVATAIRGTAKIKDDATYKEVDSESFKQNVNFLKYYSQKTGIEKFCGTIRLIGYTRKPFNVNVERYIQVSDFTLKEILTSFKNLIETYFNNDDYYSFTLGYYENSTLNFFEYLIVFSYSSMADAKTLDDELKKLS